MTIRNDVNGIPMTQNHLLEVTKLPEELKPSKAGVAKVAQMAGFVRVIIRGEVNSTSVPRDRLLEVT